jgi:hypothetical protein
VLRYGLLRRNRGYIEFEILEKQCWSYLGKIKAAINDFYKRLHIIYHRKNLAEHWDLQNTGVFYSTDVASEFKNHE